jgi:hypothetical protein
MEATRYVDLERKLCFEVFFSLPLTPGLLDVVRGQLSGQVQLDLRRQLPRFESALRLC